MAVSTDQLSPEQVLAHVLRARARQFRCQVCGGTASMLVTLGPYGRLPVKCEACEPHSQAWVRERESRPLRDLILRMHGRLAELEAERSAPPPLASSRRAARFGEPGRVALAEAMRVVARAAGREALREALYDLSAVAQGWARRL